MRREISASRFRFRRDGNDSLLSIEHVRFAERTINVNHGNGLFDAATTTHYHRRLPCRRRRALALQRLRLGTKAQSGRVLFRRSSILAANSDVRASRRQPEPINTTQTGWRQGLDPDELRHQALLLHNPDVAARASIRWRTSIEGMAEGRATYRHWVWR